MADLLVVVFSAIEIDLKRMGATRSKDRYASTPRTPLQQAR